MSLKFLSPLLLIALAAPATAAEIDDVKALYRTLYENECSWALGGSPDMVEPEMFAFSYKDIYDTDDAPLREVRLYRIFCFAGAYNESHVYFTVENDLDIKPLAFVAPQFEVQYKTPDNDETVKAITITGYGTQTTIANSEVDAATGTISGVGYWRGLGDASSASTYALENGQYRLVRYTIDASYDGEVNPSLDLQFGKND